MTPIKIALLFLIFITCNSNQAIQDLQRQQDSLFAVVDSLDAVIDSLSEKVMMQKVTLLILVHDTANYDSVPYYCIHSDSINIWKLLKSAE
jgi:hypothetical protein